MFCVKLPMNYHEAHNTNTIYMEGETMHATEGELLFSSLTKINYDKRFIRIAQDFIENLSLLAGANKKESFQIALLIEECLAFIIQKYIDCRVASHIQIFFEATAVKTLRIEITDIGPPIHEHMIPSFDVMNENSEAGLWYKVVRELSDKFVFMNKLGAGWLIQLEKNIENMTFTAGGKDGRENDSLVCQEDASGEKQSRPATIGDVPALIDLAYMTYRYSYVFPDFYDAEMLKKYIDEQLYDITVIEHGKKVIGAYAIKYADAARLSAEVGAAMISPDYRGAEAIGLIVREVDAYVRTNPHHCEFFTATAVTSHLRSQKSLSRVHNGFKPLLIFLNMLPKPEFIGIDHNTDRRESGLYVYHLNQKLKMKKLYSPAANYVPIIEALIASTGNDVEVLTEFSEPENPESRISVHRVDVAQFATISIESIGQDWFSRLSRRIFGEIAAGMESVRVTIPASGPLPTEMEGMLTDLNLVFCGLSPRSLENVDLAYCLTTKPVDFSLIQMYEPAAQNLLKHIEQNYCRDRAKEQG